MIYVNKIENTFTFKVKTVYYLEFLTSEIIKLFGSTKSQTTNYKNGQDVPHFQSSYVVLIRCNFVNNNYQQDSTGLYTFVPNWWKMKITK